jgi:hypothetical protein
MTPKTIAPLVLALVLGALPASATHRFEDSPHRRDRERESARIEAEAQEAKIDKLAQRLERATAELASEAAVHRRKGRWREWRAVDALRRLEREADRYQARVSRHGAVSRRAGRAFEDLECAYQAAVARRSDLRGSYELRESFERVGFLMGKLDRRIAKLDRSDRGDEWLSKRSYEPRRQARRDWRSYVAFHFGF